MSTHVRTALVVVRLLADVLMVNAALIIGLLLRWLWLVAFEGGSMSTPSGYVATSPTVALEVYVQTYFKSSLYLTLICLIVFYASGFYTRGRIYQGRYKAAIVAQAVSLSYVIFGALVYFLGGFLEFSRGAIVLAWAFTLLFLVGARLWSSLWRAIARIERQLFGPTLERKIQHVLVIGGAGYIGSALLPKLLDRGYRVRLLDLLLYGTEPIASVLNHPRLELVQADFRQVDKVTEAIRDVDAVIHLGAIVGDPACAFDEALTIDVNLMATRMIAEVAKSTGVNRLIFASTCSVYGASDETLDERSALHPVSLYARSKIASEAVLMSMAGSGFAPVVLRFGTIYGLSGRTRFDLVVNLLTAKAVFDGQITVYGGSQWRPFVHVDDAAMAVLTALESPLGVVRNQVFNVGSDEQNYTIEQIAKIVHQVVPTAQLITAGLDGDRRNYRVSFAKIHRLLGYEPRRTIEMGAREVLQAITSGRVADYRDAKYNNEKFLSEEGVQRFGTAGVGWARQLINESWPSLNIDDFVTDPPTELAVARQAAASRPPYTSGQGQEAPGEAAGP
jgi:nucleoside-diphosphate-sugar epimerase